MPPFLRLVTAAASVLLAAAPAGARGPDGPLRGRWVLDPDGRAVGPEDFRRGLQPSGLLHRDDELWSVGDQRSQFPGHLLRIDPRTGRLAGAPVRLRLPPPHEGENPHFARYRELPNADLEGCAVHPGRRDLLFAVTEDKTPWIITVRVEDGPDGAPPEARVEHIAEVEFGRELAPWRGSTNFRLEGLAVADDGETLYLAYERAEDDLPRILAASLAAARTEASVRPRVLPVRFDRVARRPDKARARLNVNDIEFVRRDGRPWLVAVARDQERVLWIDLRTHEVASTVDLDLRAPDGKPIHWVSPEGLACDPETDRLWIVNDPDSVRGNYRRRGSDAASGRFAEYAPLLFTLRLSETWRPEAAELPDATEAETGREAEPAGSGDGRDHDP